jgi:hypothetical protein
MLGIQAKTALSGPPGARGLTLNQERMRASRGEGVRKSALATEAQIHRTWENISPPTN